jgi:VWFA-related protein
MLALSFLTLAFLAAIAATGATPAILSQARELAMYVSVVDGDGKPVTDVKPDEFVIRENGVRREVLRASRATDPMQVALVVDNSQAASGVIHDLRDGVQTFIRAMAGDNQVAIIGAAERPTIIVDYTSDLDALEKGIGKLFSLPGSGSYVLQSIIEVSQGIERRESERPVIVVVSTNGPEFSDRFHDLVLEPLQRSGAAMHVLMLENVPVSGPTGNDNFAESWRERLSAFDKGTRASGGRYDTLLAAQALPAKLRQVADELKNQYKVTYARPEALIQPDTFEVGVTRQGLTARGTPIRVPRTKK